MGERETLALDRRYSKSQLQLVLGLLLTLRSSLTHAVLRKQNIGISVLRGQFGLEELRDDHI